MANNENGNPKIVQFPPIIIDFGRKRNPDRKAVRKPGGYGLSMALNQYEREFLDRMFPGVPLSTACRIYLLTMLGYQDPTAAPDSVEADSEQTPS